MSLNVSLYQFILLELLVSKLEKKNSPMTMFNVIDFIEKYVLIVTHPDIKKV
jgi:hypothetical protein